MKIGVSAVQGDFHAHITALEQCGVEAVEVRLPAHLEQVDGLIIPGGESTAIIKMMRLYGLDTAIRERAEQGMPVYGTCAGLIVMAKQIADYPEQPSLGILDIVVRRNAFGRQIDSFETELSIDGVQGAPMMAVFIRAPYVQSVGDDVEVLAEVKGHPVLVKQGMLLGGAFHPELTNDVRLHQMFLKMVQGDI